MLIGPRTLNSKQVPAIIKTDLEHNPVHNSQVIQNPDVSSGRGGAKFTTNKSIHALITLWF